MIKDLEIFRNENRVTAEEVLRKFKNSIQEIYEDQPDEELDMLVELYAKNPVDKFIVSKFPTVEVAQGDILIWAKGTDMYNQNIKRLKNLQKKNDFILQENDSVTGDHKVVPLPNSNISLMIGDFYPALLQNDLVRSNNKSVKGLILKSDKSFLIVHREHGNIALPKGEYMITSQLDPRTLQAMVD